MEFCVSRYQVVMTQNITFGSEGVDSLNMQIETSSAVYA
jgi:hypothetical protein